MRNPRHDPLGPSETDDASSPHGRKGRAGSERRCVLTGRNGPRDALIRLAIAPDGAVFPDAQAKAPGRGAWIGVSRRELEQAIAGGRLKGALSRAFKGTIDVAGGLPAAIEDALRRAMLDRLGLEMRSGRLILGSDRIANDARQGKAAALYHAADASEDGRRKLDQAWRVGLGEEGSGRQGAVLPLDRDALSVALGRANVVHLALADARSAERVGIPLARLHMFLGSDGGAPPVIPDGDTLPG